MNTPTIQRVAFIDTWAFSSTLWVKRKAFDASPQDPDNDVRLISLTPLIETDWPNGKQLVGRVLKALSGLRNDGTQPQLLDVWLEKLMPKGHTQWQRDIEGAKSQLRFHLPIVTNPHTTIFCAPMQDCLPTGFLTYVDISRYISAINDGETPSIHLVVEVAKPETPAVN